MWAFICFLKIGTTLHMSPAGASYVARGRARAWRTRERITTKLTFLRRAAMAGKKALRSAIFQFYQIHKTKGKKYIVDHFKDHGYTKCHIYKLIKTFESTGTDQMKNSKTGRKRKLSKSDAKKLKKAVNNKTGVSQRKLARKFKVCQKTVSNEIKNQDVSYLKRKRAPATTEAQKQRQKE